jgi:hypothetical protein
MGRQRLPRRQGNGRAQDKFRPSDVCVGPDGAIYMSPTGLTPVSAVTARCDDGFTGAIYRIAPKGFKSVVPQLDLNTVEGQIAALKSPAVNVRFGGFNRIEGPGSQSCACRGRFAR